MLFINHEERHSPLDKAVPWVTSVQCPNTV